MRSQVDVSSNWVGVRENWVRVREIGNRCPPISSLSLLSLTNERRNMTLVVADGEWNGSTVVNPSISFFSPYATHNERASGHSFAILIKSLFDNLI